MKPLNLVSYTTHLHDSHFTTCSTVAELIENPALSHCAAARRPNSAQERPWGSAHHFRNSLTSCSFSFRPSAAQPWFHFPSRKHGRIADRLIIPIDQLFSQPATITGLLAKTSPLFVLRWQITAATGKHGISWSRNLNIFGALAPSMSK